MSDNYGTDSAAYNAGYASQDAGAAVAVDPAVDPQLQYAVDAQGNPIYYNEQDPNAEGYEMGEYGDEYAGYGAYDPNAQGYDPNADPNAAAYDPNAYPAEGGWEGYDPQQQQMYDSQGNPIANEFGDVAQQQQLAGDTGSQVAVTTTAGTTTAAAAAGKGGAVLTPEEGGAVIHSILHYEPKSNGWFQDVSTTIILSKGYKLHYGLQLYTVLIGTIIFGIDYLFATLYRCFSPPDVKVSIAGQSIAYFCIFLVLSFFIVTFICCVMDMMEDLWNVTPEDKRLWGIGMNEDEPPWILHAVLVLGTLFLPFMWALVLTLSRGMSVLFFVQYFFYITTIITFWLCVMCFVWLVIIAAMEKQKAFKRRHEADDFDLHISRISEEKQSWYHSMHVLEEYGLDERSLKWSLIIFLVALSTVFVIAAATAMEGTNEAWNGAWIAMALIFFTMIVFIHQASVSTRKYRGALGAIACGACFFLFGMVGCGAAESGGLFGVFLVCFISTHFMFLRKRPHTLTRREIYALYNIPYHEPQVMEDDDDVDEAWEEEVKAFNKADAYMCVCRNTCMSCFSCFNMQATFGYTHPDIIREEKRMRKSRLCARTDQKVLFYFWMLLSLCLVVSLAYERNQYVSFGAMMAKRDDTAVAPATRGGSAHPMCSKLYNSAGTAKLQVYDMMLLATLQHSFGQQFDRDFSQWFSHIPSLSRVYPVKMPQSEPEAIKSKYAEWTDYSDIGSKFHYIVVRSLGKGSAWMRNMDVWGESLALQVTSALTPFVSMWPQKHKQDFVSGTSFLKWIYGGNNATWGLEGYVSSLVAKGEGVVVIGEGFNGGLADIVGRKLQVPTVIFNAPGTQFLTTRDTLRMNHANSLHVAVEGNVYSYIDDVGGEGMTNWIPCFSGAKSANQCGQLVSTLNAVLAACGDVYGRHL